MLHAPFYDPTRPHETYKIVGPFVHATRDEWYSAMDSQREIFIGDTGGGVVFAVTKKHRESRSKRNAKDV